MLRSSHAGLGVVLAGLLLTHSTPAAAVQRLWPTAEQWQQLHASASTDAAWREIEATQARLADAARAQGAHPLETLSTGGRLRGDPVKAATETSLGDMPRIQALALRYALDGEHADALAAGDQLAQWAARNVPNGNPIDETGLEPAIFAYRIVRPTLPDAQRRAIDAWMRKIADAEIGSRDLKRKTATNNWHSHRLKTVGMIGAALDDQRLLDYARTGFRQQIADNLLPDGRSIDFVERDALSYHVYDLRPLVTLALLFSERGEDLYHWRAPNGASLARSVDWLLPYLRGDRSHAEFVGSQVPFDKARSDNGEAGHVIGAPYATEDAIPLLVLAAAYDPACAGLAKHLGHGTPSWRLAISTLPDSKR
ncbi:alginate lyase family protein [Xanthomonas sp. LMG 12462]|uniref:alginate lyase family protein n=1 Tax=Xanthomonas sp. LMG 12462 TaxID=1591134 RepID=UPI001D048405|nr:alginate lyase family protein [Xanthomonas sp. LMG 12462]